MNQCLIVIRSVLCHSPNGNSTGNAHKINNYNAFENYTFKSNPHPPMDKNFSARAERW